MEPPKKEAAHSVASPNCQRREGFTLLRGSAAVPRNFDVLPGRSAQFFRQGTRPHLKVVLSGCKGLFFFGWRAS